MATEEEEINSLTALIAQESAAAHEALRLELENYDELSLSEEDVDDEQRNELPRSSARENSLSIVNIKHKESIQASLRYLRGHLSAEELDLIKSCPKDEDGGITLECCMILNRSKRLELLRSYQQYSNLTWRIASEEKNASSNSVRCGTGFNQWYLNKVAAPYFKIEKGFSYDPNPDLLQMRANGELSCYFVSSGRRRWTVENQTNLRGAIRLSHYTNKKSKLERDLKYLKWKVSICKKKEEEHNYIDQINNFEKELLVNQENYENHFPTLDSEEFIDWEDISIKDLQGKFSPGTCKAMWRLYLHPEINNEDWEAPEIEKIHDIVSRHNYQCWETIAIELGGNRSPYLLCVHFFNALVDRYDRNQFTPEESTRLRVIIDKYRIPIGDKRLYVMPGKAGYNYIPWAKVSRDYGNSRSRTQLYMHYMYRIRDRDNRILGSFTTSEDVQILYLVGKYGENFPLIAEHMRRSTVQLRSHYLTYLKPMNTEQLRNWTLEDDEKLMDMVQLFGRRFAMISREMSRTTGSVRSRFKTIMRNVKAGTELKDISRRKRNHSQVVKRVQSKVLADSLAESREPLDIDYLRHTFKEKPTRRARITSQGRPAVKYDVVDQQLVTYFKMTAGIGRTYKRRQITEENLNRCVASIRNIFSILKVNNLDIPSTEELNAHGDSNFDEIDHHLLNVLRNDLRNDNQHEEEEIYLPPNISNICTLKGLVMGSKSVDNHLKISDLRELFNNDLEDLSEDIRNNVLYDRTVFIERLNNMLIWPSVLSLRSIEFPIADIETDAETVPEVKSKQKGRPKKDLARINKMVEARKRQRKQLQSSSSKMDIDTDDSTISEISGTDVTLDESESVTSPETLDVKLDGPVTTKEIQPIKISVQQKVILNKKPATSVEEVNKLLQAGKSLGSEKTLVKIDKKTMQQMRKNQKPPRQAKKKIKLENPYAHCRTTRSTVKASANNSMSSSENESDIAELQNDISKLDNILRKARSSSNISRTARRTTRARKSTIDDANVCGLQEDISILDSTLKSN